MIHNKYICAVDSGWIVAYFVLVTLAVIIETSFSWHLWPFEPTWLLSFYFQSIAYVQALQKTLDSCPIPGTSHCCKDPWFCWWLGFRNLESIIALQSPDSCWRMALRSQDAGPECVYCWQASTASRASQWIDLGDTWLPTRPCMYLYLFLFILLKLWVSADF